MDIVLSILGARNLGTQIKDLYVSLSKKKKDFLNYDKWLQDMVKNMRPFLADCGHWDRVLNCYH